MKLNLKKKTTILPLVILLVFTVQAYTPDSPVTISTDTQNNTTLEAFQRKTFFAHNRYWVFYSKGPETKYRTSIYGLTWTSPVVVCSVGTYNGRFSLWFDGTYVHYVRASSIPVEAIMYRRGKPNPNGTITWSTLEEQTVISVAYPMELYEPFITVDSEGYPWIGYRGGIPGTKYPNCAKSSLNNGTWQTASGFPYQLSSFVGFDGNWAVSIVPLTQQRVYAVYLVLGHVWGRLWNGASFESEETIAEPSIIDRARFAHSVVAQQNDVHLVFLDTAPTNAIFYSKRKFETGWGSLEPIQLSVGNSSFPVLSIDPSKSNLYSFWADNDVIYYKRCINGSWDSNATEWVTEVNLREDSLNCFYQTWNSRVGVLWSRGTGTSHDARFFSLPTESQGDIAPPWIENIYQQPTEGNVYPSDEVEVYANVTDDLTGVKHVILNYTIDNEEHFTVNMTHTEGNIYNATIPSFPYCTDVTYTIIAEDNANNTITSQELGYRYEYHVIPEYQMPFLIALLITATLLTHTIRKKMTSTSKTSIIK